MKVYDVVGAGFGPSNLAIAVALQDAGNANPARVRFVEAKPRFSWHENMLVRDARMQISFLKDLATQRDPTSPFTFLNYLKECGRLSKFTNLKTFLPTRVEYSDYLSWAAAQFNEFVQYGTHVVGIRSVKASGTELLEVTTKDRNGAEDILLARNLVCSTGPTPRVPCDIPLPVRDRVFHTSQFLARLSLIEPDFSGSILVIGGGQSAVECAMHLHDNFPKGLTTICTRRHALRPSDDSSFVNEIFFNENVDHWFSASEPMRRALLDQYANTNYSVVDSALIDRLYEVMYQHGINCQRTKPPIAIQNGIEFRSIEAQGALLGCRFENVFRGGSVDIQCDYVVLATGYDSAPPQFLANAIRDGSLLVEQPMAVDRTYRITRASGEATIFCLGVNEATHGVGDTLISNMASRAAEVVTKLLERSEQ